MFVFTVVDHAADQLPVRFRAGLAGDRSVALDGLESERPRRHTRARGSACRSCWSSAQVALSLFLAVGAGLFARSFNNLVSQPLGFEDQVLWVAISPSLGGYQPEELPALYARIIERVEAIPGVQSATVAMCGMMTGCRSNADGLAITATRASPASRSCSRRTASDPSYFSTVGMTIAAGRDFEAREIGTDASLRSRQRSDGAEVLQGPRSDRPALRLRQAGRDRDHRRGRATRTSTPSARPRCRWRSIRSTATPSLCRLDARPRHRRCGTDWPGGAEGAAGNRAAVAGRSRHDDRDAGGEHVAAGATDRAADHGGRACSRWRWPASVSTD